MRVTLDHGHADLGTVDVGVVLATGHPTHRPTLTIAGQTTHIAVPSRQGQVGQVGHDHRRPRCPARRRRPERGCPCLVEQRSGNDRHRATVDGDCSGRNTRL